MEHLIIKRMLAGFLVNLIVVSNAWADRVLIKDNDQIVSFNGALNCEKAAQVTIDTINPEVYDIDSTQLQKISDSVRAMLHYECPELSTINVTGFVRGLEGIVYEGNLAQRNNWLIQETNAVINQNADQGDMAQLDKSKFKQELSITDLQLGMTVEQVFEKLSDNFKAETSYDPQTGIMRMSMGGCPTEFDINHDSYRAQENWKCLKAQLSDSRIARLERLELVQVVSANTSMVRSLLIEKYGQPNKTVIAHAQLDEQLNWYARTDEEDEGNVHALTAEITSTGSNLVVTNLMLSKQVLGNDSLVGFDVNLSL